MQHSQTLLSTVQEYFLKMAIYKSHEMQALVFCAQIKIVFIWWLFKNPLRYKL